MGLNEFGSKLYIYIMVISLCLIGLFIILKIFKEIGIMNFNKLIRLKEKCLFGMYSAKKKLNFSKIIKLNDDKKKNLRLFFSLALITLFSRLIIFLLAFIWNYYNQEIPQGFLDSFKGLWVKWDSSNYIFLAENWYVNEGEPRLYIAFYPLYPLLMRILTFVIKDSLLAGVIVSNTCIAFASYYLYKLVNLDFDDKTSFAAVKYMLIFPFSFYFGIVFTESLFIMLSIIFFYHLRKHNWALAGIFGFLSATTKNQGIILFAPAVVEIIISLELPNIRYIFSHKKRVFTNFLKRFVWTLFIPMGFGTYLCLNKVVTGSWFKFLEYQSENWNNELAFIVDTLKYHFRYLETWDSQMYKITIWLPQLVFLFIIVVLMLYGLKKLRGSYLLYTYIYTIIIYSSTWLISGSRYVLCLFPLFILTALVSQKNKYVDFSLTFISIIFLGYYTLAYIQNAVI
ncbi:hypothetical protein RBH29_00100 [Herbivorax sp. ANBcel31]|uniref:glycosyltransferase family 39 protein n=1 Tax=Herbivorax sp. ANBcel31 TaxID=3069754 RepID=UPI0027B34776|nr:glycosyltransferase family 39 protein [Herbivorax sp. ANBcel31]MDQ2084836.1 hypothetical protein [Herbivorax sp. ANBcel31]